MTLRNPSFWLGLFVLAVAILCTVAGFYNPSHFVLAAGAYLLWLAIWTSSSAEDYSVIRCMRLDRLNRQCRQEAARKRKPLNK